MSMSDPFAIIRAATGDPAATVTPSDLFAGSEPIDIATANTLAEATATDAAALSAATPPAPAVAVSENVLEAAILALEDRVKLLERMAKQNGWNV